MTLNYLIITVLTILITIALTIYIYHINKDKMTDRKQMLKVLLACIIFPGIILFAGAYYVSSNIAPM